MTTRFLAVSLTLALLLTSPGLMPYQAMAALQRGPAGPNATPKAGPVVVVPGKVSAAASLPQSAVPAAAPQAAAQAAAPEAAAVRAEKLAASVAPQADASGAKAEQALNTGYDNLADAAKALPFEIGAVNAGEYAGRDAVWKKIVELNKTQDVKFIVVADSAEQQYELNGGANIIKGKANELARDGFMARGVSEDAPHTALSLFVGEQENVALYIDNVFGYKVAKVVKQRGGYAGSLSAFDKLMQSNASSKAAQTPPSPELIKDSTPSYGVGAVHKLSMRLMSVVWKLVDDALGSRWDRIKPLLLRTAYLYANEQPLRLTVNDVNKTPKATQPPASADKLLYRSGDGSHFDPSHPDMGKSNVSYFTQIGKPKGPPPAIDEKSLQQSVRNAQIESREIDPKTGKPIIIEAGILNDHAASWIQFMVHDWMNHKRKAAGDNPYLVKLPEGHPMIAQGFTHMKLDRTEDGKMVDGAPAFVNELTPGWDLSMIYGASDEIQATVRDFETGKLKIGADKRLLDDPRNPGVPLTGFNDNMTPQLTFLHTMFTLEHNFLVDTLKAEHPEYNAEELFQMARLRLTAAAAKIHTVEWTRALLPQDGLQEGMWADWYGFLDKKPKGWVMRFSHRHPILGKLLGFILKYELIFGIPGTGTTHYGKDYAMPEEFVDVYRLHTMIRDHYKLQHMKTNANGEVEMEVTMELPFEDMAGYKTMGLSRGISMEDQAISWAMESAGALTLKNMPLALRRLHTQDGQHKDMAIVHDIRIKERSEANTYVKFTMKLGEKPPKTFLELTGGDKASADLLAKFFDKVEDVPFRIGILAERKPKDFALGNRQFKVFVLMAPRRLKSDKFLSQMFDPKYYGGIAGINYIENTTMSTMVMRHFPGTRQALEGLDNFFKPIPQPGSLPQRLAAHAEQNAETLGKRVDNLVLLNGAVIGGLGLLAAFSTAAWAPALASFVIGLGAVVLLAKAKQRLSSSVDAMKELLDPKRRDVAARTALYAARSQSSRAAAALNMSSGAVLLSSLATAGVMAATAPVLAAGFAVAALAATLMIRKKNAETAQDLQNIGIALNARMPHEKVDPASLGGETALQKRYWFLVDGKANPVANFKDTYVALHASGLSASTSWMTALLSHLKFSGNTQKNMTADEKATYNPGRFGIYVPNLIDAQDYSNTRVYAARDNKKGLKPGDVDMEEFNRMFREAGEPLELTAYTLGLVREESMARDAAQGRGTWLKRLIGRYAAKRRADQLIELFADRVVWEEAKYGKWVPAISRERLLEFYQGSAQRQLLNEKSPARNPQAFPYPAVWNKDASGMLGELDRFTRADIREDFRSALGDPFNANIPKNGYHVRAYRVVGSPYYATQVSDERYAVIWQFDDATKRITVRAVVPVQFRVPPTLEFIRRLVRTVSQGSVEL